MTGVRALNVAVLGADDPLGTAFLRLLSERDVEFGEVFPLTLAETEGCATVRGEELPLLDVVGFDWSRVDVLVNASRAVAAELSERTAADAGCRILGLGRGAAGIARVSVEGALAIALQRVLAPVQAGAGLRAVNAVAMLPVAVAGEAGIAELAGQTRALFAMETVEPEAFPLQIAFNLIPQVGAVQADGGSHLEQDTAGELRQLLDNRDLAVSVTAVWAPMFYGAGVAVHASVAGDLDLESMRARFADLPGVTLMDTAVPGGVATPATDAQDSDAVFVSRVRAGADARHDLAMWLVFDVTTLEAARLVDGLENLIEK
ncbi:hypothetical protein EZJ19_02280 [Parasulfuritortus cantonensis]|uniref:Semialdehyde dehydrogenase dimerisation domain-containing protein n=1 Tax=Parasulfuritortus cantonensis TaxID=2528202 RepID=A0A4R1BM64_9PROT|nr:Asd/ArgC dimerization domain-containing protein [Parasulfuritortus cantonensis]TCJ18561.1 hypothetical protein EZJ19_02280 [Parasulfuritortus cantonensis]